MSRNARHQVILFGQVSEIVEYVVVACVASVPVRFKRKENSARVLAARKIFRAAKFLSLKTHRNTGTLATQANVVVKDQTISQMSV